MKTISKAAKYSAVLPVGRAAHRPVTATLSSNELKRIVAAVLG